MNSRKLFLSDLDGTLLNSQKIITPATAEAIRKFSESGNVFAICTGRALDSAAGVQKSLGIDYAGSFVVCFNGACIWSTDEKKVIYRVGVPLDITKNIFALAEESHVHIHTYNEKYIVSRHYGEEMAYYRNYIPSPAIVTEDILSELPEEPCKLIAISLRDRPALDRFRAEIDRKYGDCVTTVYSNPYYLEIFNRQAGKGSGLLRLAKYLGIPRENTLAAGDGENDISMLRAAGCGIAMCNAEPMVREAADAVTEEDNDHDGLVPWITR